MAPQASSGLIEVDPSAVLEVDPSDVTSGDTPPPRAEGYWEHPRGERISQSEILRVPLLARRVEREKGWQWRPPGWAPGRDPTSRRTDTAIASGVPVIGTVNPEDVLIPRVGVNTLGQIPTRAKAGQKFQEVMGAVGEKAVDVAQPGNIALRIGELAERGGSMPKVVRDLLRRATDPTKGSISYQEMRDFYSNVSRLSADEMKRLAPVIRTQLGALREAMHETLARTAASGGKEAVYRAAMREYAMASWLREVAKKAAKYTAGALGAATAYKVGKDILD